MNNPMDTTAAAVPVEFEGILQELAADSGNDAVLFIFVRPAMLKVEEVEAALHRVAAHFRRNKKPLLVCSMGHTGLRAEIGTTGKFIPSYVFPENAVAALAKAVEYSERRARPESAPVKFSDINREEANKIITTALKNKTNGPKWLSSEQISGLLKCYGIRFAETKFARTAAEAAAIAGKIGYPVVLKLASSTITHKTDVGGVCLNLKSENEVIDAFKSIKDKLTEIGKGNQMDGVTVQKMVIDGIETIIGVSNDPSFGPLIMFGMGGVNAEVLNDIAFRLNPLTELDAEELIGSVKVSKLLGGFRGNPPGDTAGLKDLLLRLSVMVDENPQIAELDFNPVKVLPAGDGYWVVDARIAVK
jgi:acyl-CoA synthetase (NDP forming)